MNKSRSGFTIVELLIVIVVIGILAAITIVAYNGVQQRARDTERKQDIANIQKVLELYYIDHDTFPAAFELEDPAWRSANLAAKDQGIFINPQHKNATNSLVPSGSSVPIDRYSYYAVKDGTLCSTSETCKGYRMSYKLEVDPLTNINIFVDR